LSTDDDIWLALERLQVLDALTKPETIAALITGIIAGIAAPSV
jgi:hypothetical protein